MKIASFIRLIVILLFVRGVIRIFICLLRIYAQKELICRTSICARFYRKNSKNVFSAKMALFPLPMVFGVWLIFRIAKNTRSPINSLKNWFVRNAKTNTTTTQ